MTAPNLCKCRYASWNVRTLLANTTNRTLFKKRNSIRRTIVNIMKTHHFINLQETHLGPHETTYLNDPRWHAFYNNAPTTDGGTAILVSKTIPLASLTHQIITPGYTHRLLVGDTNAPSIVIENFYGFTGSKRSEFIPQLNTLAATRPHRNTVAAGDWNIKTSPHQTSSTFVPPPILEQAAYEAYLETRSLHVVPSNIHTYIHGKSKVSTHLLDRFYTDLSQADHLLYTPSVAVKTHLITTDLSDHLPISLFRPHNQAKQQTQGHSFLDAQSRNLCLFRSNSVAGSTRPLLLPLR